MKNIIKICLGLPLLLATAATALVACNKTSPTPPTTATRKSETKAPPTPGSAAAAAPKQISLPTVTPSGVAIPDALRKNVDKYRTACEQKKPEGCYAVGMMFDHRKMKAYTDAYRAYTQACDAKVADACYRMGLHHWRGLGQKQDPAQAAALFSKGCQLRKATKKATYFTTARSCGALGAAQIAGQGIKKDEKGGLALVDEACQMRQPEACFLAGTLRLEKETNKSLASLKIGCSMMGLVGCMTSSLDTSYLGLPSAAAPATKAAALIYACCAAKRKLKPEAGKRLKEGEGLPPFLKKACTAGFKEACVLP